MVDMQKQGPKWWLVGLIILAGVYLSMIALFVGLSLFITNIIMLPYVIVGLSALLVAYGVCLTYKEKQTKGLSASLAIAGIVFIIVGGIVFVPFTSSQAYGTVRSFDYTYGIVLSTDINVHICDLNGTLIEQTVQASSSNTYVDEGNFPHTANSSIFQIEFSASGKLNLQMGLFQGFGFPYFTALNATSYWTDPVGSHWMTLWWTPPTISTWRIEFVLTNLENQPVSFYLKMTDFYHAETINASNTNYRSVMDSSLGYIGLSMVCVAVAISVYSNKRPRTTEKNDIPRI